MSFNADEIILFCNREDYESFVSDHMVPKTFWAAGSVLTDSEVSKLRIEGHSVSIFADEIDLSSNEQVQDAMNVLREHHPGKIIQLYQR